VKVGPFTAVFVLACFVSALLLFVQFPFAFYSPDMGLHAAKLLRAQSGELFRDPVSGTPSIYPSLFHAVFGLGAAGLGLCTLDLTRVIQIVNLLGLLVAFRCAARAVLGDGEDASACALCLPLLFYAPSGRHVLVQSPANFALPFVMLGVAMLVQHLASGRVRPLFWGFFFVSLAANVAWYHAVSVAALAGGLALVRRGRMRAREAALTLLAIALPCGFTAYHLFAIRSFLPSYADWAAAEAATVGGVEWTRGGMIDWLTNLVTKGNGRFQALLERSATARLHYYAAVLPFTTALLVATPVLALRVARSPKRGVRELAWMLLATAMLIFALSAALNPQKDPPRTQFAGWAVILLFAFFSARALGCCRSSWLRAGAVALGLFALAYTVRHTDQPFTRALPRTTQAVVDWIASVPAHREARIFLSRRNLRRLNVFVEFLSFVNHSDGRYHAQDPGTTSRLLAAYLSIFERRGDWLQKLAENDCRYLIFRHVDGGEERDAGLFYLRHGRAVLANPEWWVIEVDPARTSGGAH
jgi:hypothetical protein